MDKVRMMDSRRHAWDCKAQTVMVHQVSGPVPELHTRETSSKIDINPKDNIMRDRRKYESHLSNPNRLFREVTIILFRSFLQRIMDKDRNLVAQ